MWSCDTINPSWLGLQYRGRAHAAEAPMFDLPDDEILPLSKEHVFWTWSAQAAVRPIAVKSAKGVYFWDVDGQALPRFQLDDHVRQHRPWRLRG